jgi:hypothetical protein
MTNYFIWKHKQRKKRVGGGGGDSKILFSLEPYLLGNDIILVFRHKLVEEIH